MFEKACFSTGATTETKSKQGFFLRGDVCSRLKKTLLHFWTFSFFMIGRFLLAWLDVQKKHVCMIARMANMTNNQEHVKNQENQEQRKSEMRYARYGET